MKSLLIVASLVLAGGCLGANDESNAVGPVSRLNEFSFANDSGEMLSKVVVEWHADPFTITNEYGVLGGNGTYVHKVPINSPLEVTFRITADFPDGRDSLVHEVPARLDPKEKQRIDVKLTRDLKFSVQLKQRNPHIN